VARSAERPVLTRRVKAGLSCLSALHTLTPKKEPGEYDQPNPSQREPGPWRSSCAAAVLEILSAPSQVLLAFYGTDTLSVLRQGALCYNITGRLNLSRFRRPLMLELERHVKPLSGFKRHSSSNMTAQ
jgi:hypothetical protein